VAESRNDALTIWRAGVDAVRSDVLVRQHVHATHDELCIGTCRWSADAIGRIAVVGAGKAGAGMAAGLEAALGRPWLDRKSVTGWINVPADCLRPLSHIHLHAARPAACNEPTAEGVVGSTRILQIVSTLGAGDLCVCLISGGGSALLPAPRPGVTLADLLQVTRALSAAGATIQQLNAVRKRLSLIQGGGLARACRAGHLMTLIVSDVLGDPLEVIASGPTVVEPDERAAAQEALRVFDAFDLQSAGVAQQVRQLLVTDLAQATADRPTARVVNQVIGNNQSAVDAAVRAARAMGYTTVVAPPDAPTVTADEVGTWMANQVRDAMPTAASNGPWCLVSGGEPVVKLAPPPQRGRGGRNQQLVLAALCDWLRHPPAAAIPYAMLSGGTDGEDGPTDAAGALFDSATVAQVRHSGLDPDDFLRRNDAYSFWGTVGGLLRTGPTHTNVCDLRVAVCGKSMGGWG
jgi:hydroxypyruvate reductase